MFVLKKEVQELVDTMETVPQDVLYDCGGGLSIRANLYLDFAKCLGLMQLHKKSQDICTYVVLATHTPAGAAVRSVQNIHVRCGTIESPCYLL